MEVTNYTTTSFKKKLKLRISGYKDYIAIDEVDKDGNILTTPLYIKNGQQLELHTPIPSSEQIEFAKTYEDFHDKWLLKMEKGELFMKWIDGPCFGTSPFSKILPQELLEWNFNKIVPLSNNELEKI